MYSIRVTRTESLRRDGQFLPGLAISMQRAYRPFHSTEERDRARMENACNVVIVGPGEGVLSVKEGLAREIQPARGVR